MEIRELSGRFAFGNNHRQFDHAHINGLIKNGACNELDLDLQTEAGDDRVDLIAIHLRSYTFASGTIRSQNVY